MKNSELQAIADSYYKATDALATEVQKVAALPEIRQDPRIALCLSHASVRMQEAGFWINAVFGKLNQTTEDNLDAAVDTGMEKAGLKVVK